MAPQAAAGARPVTTPRIYLTQRAEELDIPVNLALAMVAQESSGEQDATSSKGAMGLFQLMPETAAELGVDPTDPIQNIDGGLRYFKQQLDAHEGNVQLALAAYNAGPGAVAEAGGVPDFPETQDYIARVLGRLEEQEPSAPAAATGAPETAPAAALGPPGAAPSQSTAGTPVDAQEGADDPSLIWQLGSSLASSLDPRTFTGRVNLAATAGTLVTGGGALGVVGLRTALAAGVLPWLARRLLTMPVVAAAAGGGQAALEQAIGTAPEGTSAVTEGVLQGAYEVGGRMLLWPLRRIGAAAMARRVAGRARETLEAGLTRTRETGRAMIATVNEAAASVADTLKLLRQASTTARQEAAEGVSAAGLRAAEGGAGETAEVAGRLAQQELDVAADLATLTKQYDNLMAQPPGTIAAGEAATNVMRGPAQRALDIAGQRVRAAAEEGPSINFAPVKEALEEMAEQVRPAVLFGEQAEAGTRGIGFLDNIRGAGRAAASADFDPSALNRAIATQLGIDPTTMSPKLPGLLGKILRAPDAVTFADAHQVKMLLDEAVGWDRIAKKHLERLTKGVRQALRGQMAGFAPYDEATALYAATVPLYRRGIGRQILRLARDPDGAARIADTLSTRDPAQALTLRTLLLDQAAAGGNPKMGQEAWDSVREIFTHNHIVRGGIEGLSDRVQTLLSEAPEFARALYNDLPSQKVLSNLDRLGAGWARAVERGQTQRLGGRAAQAGAKRADVRAMQKEGRAAVAGAEEMLTAFKKSTAGKLLTREQMIADFIRGVGLGPMSIWGTLSIARLAYSASGDDLLRWAAYSDQSTQLFLRVLYGQASDRVTAGFIRAASSAMYGSAAAAERELNLPPPPDVADQR